MDHNERSREEIDESVRHNFEMLLQRIQSYDNAESIGGNAFRHVENGITYSCYAINGVINRNTLIVRMYDNDLRDLQDDEEAFSLVFGVPPVELLLKGQSDILLDATSAEIHGTLSANCHSALMAIKPLYDKYMREKSIHFLHQNAYKPTDTLLGKIRKAVNDLFRW